MDFNTLGFLGFFAVCTVLYYIIPKIAKPYFLLIASYAFYCYKPENRALVALLIGATIITWACGIALNVLKDVWARRGVLALSVVSCIGILFYFKYANFFSELLGFSTAESSNSIDLIAPLGLSYFTFQALGYAIDCYRKKYKPINNALHYALFVSFFPSIFTGPIERADHIMPQFLKPAKFDYNNVSGGAFRMLWGYFKKMVIADNLAVYVSAFYAGTVETNGPTLAVAAALFSLQLYFDFSGCCDMVIGGARMFGIKLLENFNSPFLATSYSELWKRWHKSLTNWFRDYVYFSLGGSRCSMFRWAINFMLVFILSGLWHGAALGYLYWGILCGALVLVERIPKKLQELSKGNTHNAHSKHSATPKHLHEKPRHTVHVLHDSAPAPATHGEVEFIDAQSFFALDEQHEALQTTNHHKHEKHGKHSKHHEPIYTSVGHFIGVHILNFFKRIFVFAEFSLCFVLFASALYKTEIASPLTYIFTDWNSTSFEVVTTAFETLNLTGNLAWVLFLGVILVFVIEAFGDVSTWIRNRFFLWRWVLYYALSTAILYYGVFGKSAFIYQLY